MVNREVCNKKYLEKRYARKEACHDSISIFHGCKVWIEKSVTRDHCSASLGKPRPISDPRGRFCYPHQTPMKDTYTIMASLVMPISGPRDRFFYPHHAPMKDTYSLAHGLRQLTRNAKSGVSCLQTALTRRTENLRPTFAVGRRTT